MSSSRVAVKPRAMNSSSAASMMAWRRSAARSARFGFGNGSGGETIFVSLARAPPLAARRLAGRERNAGFARDFVMIRILLTGQAYLNTFKSRGPEGHRG